MFRLRAKIALAVAALAAGCVTVPTLTSRDTAVLSKDVRRTETSGGLPLFLAFDRKEEQPVGDMTSPLGGLQEDFSFRRGLGGGKEQAVRLGLAFSGAYGGYERAHEIIGPGKFGVTGFFGGVAGVNSLGFMPNVFLGPFVQPYGGLIAGRTAGTLRPEVVVRALVQSGYVSKSRRIDGTHFYMYALGSAVIEPRLRIQTRTYSLYGGLQAGAGYARCQECLMSIYTEPVVVVTPTVGISFEPQE